MNPKITLTNPTDDELSAAVARYVAKLYQSQTDWDRLLELHKTTIAMFPPFSTSADAVLPLLENEKKRGMWVQIKDHTNGIDCGKRDWLVIISDFDDCCDPYEGEPGYPKPGARLYCEGVSHFFPRAACLALLRANGVEVVT